MSRQRHVQPVPDTTPPAHVTVKPTDPVLTKLQLIDDKQDVAASRIAWLMPEVASLHTKFDALTESVAALHTKFDRILTLLEAK